MSHLFWPFYFTTYRLICRNVQKNVKEQHYKIIMENRSSILKTDCSITINNRYVAICFHPMNYIFLHIPDFLFKIILLYEIVIICRLVMLCRIVIIKMISVASELKVDISVFVISTCCS